MIGDDVIVRDAVLELLRMLESKPDMARLDVARGFAMASAQYYTQHRDLEAVATYLRQQAAMMTVLAGADPVAKGKAS